MSFTQPPPSLARKHVIPTTAGLTVDGSALPLIAGSIHYWRLDPRAWRHSLVAIRQMGCHLVDTYVPWAVHERGPGEFDFGTKDPQLDVVAFLELATRVGLKAIVRPGPNVNAGLTCFGVPKRVVWNEACQARSAEGNPVVLPSPPLAFPVPSYASEAYFTEVEQWLNAVGEVLGPLARPGGPIVMVQVDNESTMFFRDGLFDQDYHPDAIAQFRRFLQRKYRKVPALRDVYQDDSITFADVQPPRSFEAEVGRDLAPYLDWAEFQEHLLADALDRMGEALGAAGFDGVPLSHNMPPGETTTPLDADRIGRVVDVLGYDFSHTASSQQRRSIARRASELATRARAMQTPAFASELGAGYPPLHRSRNEDDSRFAALCALAYGVRAYNVYMAVDRDRWIGAPIDDQGEPRPFADFWLRLAAAIERTGFTSLDRQTPVKVVVPRCYRRLLRVLHALGPVPAALMDALGGGAALSCDEGEFDLGAPVALETARFIDCFVDCFEARGIAYAFTGGDLIEDALDDASWLIIPCPGALEPRLRDVAWNAIEAGRAITLGPFEPTRDPTFRLWQQGNARRLPQTSPVPTLVGASRGDASAAVIRAVEHLSIPERRADDPRLQLELHSGDTRDVLFVINPMNTAITSKVAVGDARRVDDALEDRRLTIKGGEVEVQLSAHSVAMLDLQS